MNQPTVTGPLNLMHAKALEAWHGFFYQLPNIIAALIFLVVAWYASKLLARSIAALARSRGRPDLGNVLGAVARGGMLILAVLFAAAIVFPSVKPGDVFATLGIGSVAIGFAFKDILQNMLAGLLLLIRRPYRRGDQIVVKEFEGTVERIESRATLIKTYDGRRVIIPNSDIYTSPVIVNTAYPSRRDEYVVGVGYGDEAADAARIFVEVMKSVEGVLADPAPEALPWQLGDSTVDLKLRWWAESRRTEQVHVRARVILAVFEAAREHGIDLPFPTTVMLFHDQTEDVDGNRSRQREGWPAGKSPPKPLRTAARDARGNPGIKNK
jgi:small conductance mechanosensitive channel